MEAQGIEPWSKALPARGVVALSIPFAPCGLYALSCIVSSSCANMTVAHISVDVTFTRQHTPQRLVRFEAIKGFILSAGTLRIEFVKELTNLDRKSLDLCMKG